MKKYIINSILLVLLTSCNTKEKNNIVSFNVDTNKIIIDTSKHNNDKYNDQILKYVDSIDNNLNKFDIINKKDKASSTEGGTLKVYKKAKVLFKIESVYYRETGKNLYSLYLKDSSLVYLNQTIYDYELPINISRDAKITKTTKECFILKDLAITFYSLDGKQIIKSDFSKENSYIKKLFSEFCEALK